MASRPMKQDQHHEGSEAAWRFEHALGKILSVSKEELEKREAEHAKANSRKARRGPKPRTKATT